MIGLTLQETYGDDPDQLKKDFELLSQKGENLGKDIRVAIEEYANTDFSILDCRRKEKPVCIEDIELVVQDILSDRIWRGRDTGTVGCRIQKIQYTYNAVLH